jgi:hypothetical protein
MVGARRHFGYDAAKWRMDRRLARYALSEHFATAAHKGDRALVAA